MDAERRCPGLRSLFAGAAPMFQLVKAAPCRRPNEWYAVEKPPQPWLLVSLKEPMGTMEWDPKITENVIFVNLGFPSHGPHGTL